MKSNILVVDDEIIARQSLTDILKLEGYNAVSAPNGQAAIWRASCKAYEQTAQNRASAGAAGAGCQHPDGSRRIH